MVRTRTRRHARSRRGDSNRGGEAAAGGDEERGSDAESLRSGPSADSVAAQPLAERLRLLAAGILLVTMPAITLLVVYAVLTATRSALLDGLTLVEAAELYFIELAAFALFGYLLYRFTVRTVDRGER